MKRYVKIFLILAVVGYGCWRGGRYIRDRKDKGVKANETEYEKACDRLPRRYSYSCHRLRLLARLPEYPEQMKEVKFNET